MNLNDLQNKINHARSLSEPLPELPFNDFPSLFRHRSNLDEPYLTYVDEKDHKVTFTYDGFCDKVQKVARFLQSQGLQHGDRIATISHNHWHTVVQYYAAWLLGLVVVPVSLGEDDERIAYILENGDIELAFIRSDYRQRLSKIFVKYDQLKHIVTILCEDSLDNFAKEDGPLKLGEKSFGESEALIVFTSGTTGAPKGVVLTQRNLLEDARSIAECNNIDASTRMMCVLPIHHVNGTVVTLITPFFAGGSTVLNQRFRVSRFFPIIQQEKVHVISVVPTLLQFLNNHYKDSSKSELPKTDEISHIICSAGPLTIKVMKAFEERFNVRVIHGYGLSETTCESCFVPLDLDEKEHKKWCSDFGYPSIGVPVPANEMAIHDDEGHTLGENERGEIVIRGVNVMQGYYNNREANEETFKFGWFRSGDEGFYVNDANGRPYFFITGRLKELIIRGAINLAPLEIDEVINKAPGVKAGIAVGFENDWYGEEVGAYIQTKEDAQVNEEAILNFCRQHLPFSKSPKVVVFGDDIPVTSTGKYQRRKVKHLFEAWKDVQFRKS